MDCRRRGALHARVLHGGARAARAGRHHLPVGAHLQHQRRRPAVDRRRRSRRCFRTARAWLIGQDDVLLIASTEPLDARLANIAQRLEPARRRRRSASASRCANRSRCCRSSSAGPAELARYGAGAALQTDDRMALEFSGPRDDARARGRRQTPRTLAALLGRRRRPRRHARQRARSATRRGVARPRRHDAAGRHVRGRLRRLPAGARPCRPMRPSTASRRPGRVPRSSARTRCPMRSSRVERAGRRQPSRAGTLQIAEVETAGRDRGTRRGDRHRAEGRAPFTPVAGGGARTAGVGAGDAAAMRSELDVGRVGARARRAGPRRDVTTTPRCRSFLRTTSSARRVGCTRTGHGRSIRGTPPSTT